MFDVRLEYRWHVVVAQSFCAGIVEYLITPHCSFIRTTTAFGQADRSHDTDHDGSAYYLAVLSMLLRIEYYIDVYCCVVPLCVVAAEHLYHENRMTSPISFLQDTFLPPRSTRFSLPRGPSTRLYAWDQGHARGRV